MITADDLKASILQMAMQGKLVEQRPEEGTGEGLYQEIQKEKQKLVTEGKIKRSKKLQPITNDEIPFEIPGSWKWVRLGDVGSTNIGLTYEPSDISESGVIVLRSGNIQQGKMDYSNVIKVSCDVPERAMINKGDILICARNGSRRLVGKSAIVDRDGMAFGAFMAKFHSNILLNSYIQFYIESPLFRGSLDGVGTETINQITQRKLRDSVCPMPPLNEQRRIVAKIEELMPYVDQYAVFSEKLNALNTTFPEQMKKSILQQAIEGKLVPQDPSDEPASVLLENIATEKRRLTKEGMIKKQKKLPEITEGEIPFDIPDSWEWCRLQDLGQVVGGGTPKTGVSEYWDDNGIPWITPADMKNVKGKYIERGNRNISQVGLEKSSTQLMPKGSVLYSSRAPIGYIAIAANEICTNQGFKSFVPIAVTELNQYIYYCLIAITPEIKSRASGTTFKEISGKRFAETLIPLPPLAEQKRIVTKIEALMPHIVEIANAYTKGV
jgi:type I restriction enzyme S subunit